MRLREDRRANGYVDPYENPDAFAGFDNEESEEEEEEAADEQEEDGNELGMTSSTKSIASVSSLLAMKRERIEQQRRATISASSQFANETAKGDGLVHSLRTLNIVQNKNKSYTIAEEHKVT